MPPNFLANLGAGLRNFGSFISPEFEAGASLGAGLKRRFRRPGEREDDMDQPSSTPSFDSGASSKIPNVGEILEDPVAGAENDARRNLPINPPSQPLPRLPSRDDLPDLPIKRGDITMPALSPAPSMAELRTATPGPPVLSPRANLPIRVPAPPRPAPGAMPAPAFEPEPIRDYRGREIGDRVGFERDQYVRKGMKSPEEGGGFKRSLRMTLQNAMLGASAALSRGGGIEEALGGAIAGAGGSLINPQAGYEFGFEQGVRPKIESEMERERRNRERANMEIFNQAKLDDLRATTEERRAQAKKLGELAPRPVNRSIGVNRKTSRREFFDANDPSQLALYDPDPLKSTAREPRPPTAAELSVDPESGLSVEEMADASYKARGGDQYVFDRLPPRTRQILSAGAITTVDGKTINATQAERAAARKEFERAVERQRKTDANYTRGHIRGKRLGGKKGGKGSAQPSAYKRNINELPPLR